MVRVAARRHAVERTSRGRGVRVDRRQFGRCAPRRGERGETLLFARIECVGGVGRAEGGRGHVGGVGCVVELQFVEHGFDLRHFAWRERRVGVLTDLTQLWWCMVVVVNDY